MCVVGSQAGPTTSSFAVLNVCMGMAVTPFLKSPTEARNGAISAFKPPTLSDFNPHLVQDSGRRLIMLEAHFVKELFDVPTTSTNQHRDYSQRM